MRNYEDLKQIMDYLEQNGMDATKKKYKLKQNSIQRYRIEYNRQTKERETMGCPEATTIDYVNTDRTVKKLKEELSDYKKKYSGLMDIIENNDKIEEYIDVYNNHKVDKIEIDSNYNYNIDESTAIMVLSDAHIEENVDEDTVSGLNSYDVKVCEERIAKFFSNGMKLINIQRNGTKIDNLILALLGDLISGYIHEELLENNELSPTQAVLHIFDLLVSGIDFLLDKGDFEKIEIICADGNHGRTTEKTRVSTRYKNSFEWLLYSFLAKYYRNNNKLNIRIAKSYHIYANVYGYVLRFHHGDAIRYGGGVGGITIPVNKALSSWNNGRRADYDIFGHFHQFFDGGRFISNGSVIGYNAYALKIKASYEPPRQAFFLVNKKYGKTIVCPIVLE